jgi:glucose-6-phosphate dehydrogenase assembly protein OpcA
VSDDVWSERDTTPGKIESALRELVVERHRENSSFVAARVLNLIAIVDDDYRGEIENRLSKLGRFAPSRLILCRVKQGHDTLDATAAVASEDDDPDPGELALVRERVELRMGPGHLESLDTIVDALVVSDIATMAWAPHGHAEGVDAVRRLSQVVLLDSQDDSEVTAALARAADLRDDAYVVDLAWLRSTPWRERVAAAFDPPRHRRQLAEISKVTVRHRQDSAAAGVLFCGWLASRLGWKPAALLQQGDARKGQVRARRGEVQLCLEPTEMSSPGLGGVTIECASGESVSLDRGVGGLTETRRDRKGEERCFKVLGASRGEAGILGEGVRQALLRDHTYAPALAAAQELAG